MNWLEKIKLLHAENKKILALAKEEKRSLTEDEQKKFDTAIKNIDECKRMIDAENAVLDMDNILTAVVDNSVKPVVEIKKTKPIYKNLVEQLIDIKNAATTGIVSPKLKKIQNALGGNEGVGADGGFAIQSDFAGMILESAVKDDGILARIDEYQISSNADRVNWVDIDESDISTNVFGGIQVYWASEAHTVAKSAPKLKANELKLEKLMGFAYATMELDADSTFIDTLYTKGFTLAVRRVLTNGIVAGDGIGKPTGILAGGGLLVVPKKAAQANDTVVWENITKIYHTAIDPRNGGYAWIVHPDVHEQLDAMSVVVGTGGIPVYQPASMTGSVDTLRGIPVLTSDHCSALGDVGDIILADLSDYFLPFKGAIQKDTSIHVQFLTAETAFRFIFRVNGRPKTTSQLTIKNSSQKRGKYVTLAAR